MVSRVLILKDQVPLAKQPEDVLTSFAVDSFGNELMLQVSSALSHPGSSSFDVVVVDPAVLDNRGTALFKQIFTLVRDSPRIIFNELGDNGLAIEPVLHSGHNTPENNHVRQSFLARSLNHIESNKQIEETLFIEKSRAETTLNAISDAVITTDIDGCVDYLNKAAEQLTGWMKDDALHRPITEVMHIVSGTTRKPERNPLELVLQMNEAMGLTAGTILLRPDGSEVIIEDSASPIHDSTGRLCGAVIVFHDIYASKDMREKMAHLAQHDFLTDLPNRVLLQDRISQAIELAGRRGTTLAVLYVDLDNFKTINDSLGHDNGDKLLRSIAHRLSTSVRASDTVSRSGGDEFVLLVLGDNKTDSAATIAEKILASMTQPHMVDDLELVVTISIGISVYPSDALDAEGLIKKADMAMYRAKKQGGNGYQFYISDMKDHKVGRRDIETDKDDKPMRQDAD